MKIKMLSLFSGIGSPEEALKNIGIDIDLVGFSEINKYSIRSYCNIHNLPLSLNLGDVAKIDTSSLDKNIDLITHGSPCQDFSVAGINKGGNKGTGTRSSLMWETIRIVREVRPKFVMWENVKNVLSKLHRHNFDGYLNQMEELGYKNYYKILNSKDYGIPQNRERVFVISIRNDIDKVYEFPKSKPLTKNLKDFISSEVPEKYYLKEEVAQKIVEDFLKEKEIVNKEFSIADYRYDIGLRIRKNNLCPCFTVKVGGTSISGNPLIVKLDGKVIVRNGTKKGYLIAEEGDSINIARAKCNTRRGRVAKGIINTLDTECSYAYVEKYRIRRLTAEECWSLMGFSKNSYLKAKEVTPETQLYKQAGNSIVVNVLEEIFKNLF